MGLTALSVTYPKYMQVQFLSMVAGVVFYAVLLFFLQNPEFAKKFKAPAVICALGLLAVNLLLAKNTSGAYNWIEIGSFTIQPSEFVKVAFVFIGSRNAGANPVNQAFNGVYSLLHGVYRRAVFDARFQPRVSSFLPFWLSRLCVPATGRRFC